MITQTYTLRSSTTNILFPWDRRWRLHRKQLSSVFSSPRDFVISARGTMVRPLKYTVVSPFMCKPAMFQDSLLVKPGDLGTSGMMGGERTSNTVPEEVAGLARKLVQDLLPPEGTELQPEKIRPIAERIQSYLMSNYPYSLKFRQVNRSIDPTEDFC